MSPQELLRKQHAFFHTGQTRDVKYRLHQLKQLKAMLSENEGLLIDAVHKDFRKPPFETYATEIGLLNTEISFALKHLESWAKPKTVSSSLVNFPSKNYILTEPYGNALVIAPWNYPIQLSLLPVVGALSAGNTAILKPSELTPHTSEALLHLTEQYFDRDLFAVVLGGVEVSQSLLSLPFNFIFFTGSTRVGKIVMREAAKNLTPVTLELGGKSPCIVDESANLEVSAKRIVWGKFVNAGQTCVAPDYLMVKKSIKAELIVHLKNAITQLYGPDPKESQDYPRVINEDHFKRLVALIDYRKVVAGGESDPADHYIAPTIMDEVSWEDPVMEDEIFGPILPVLEYDSLDECIRTINAHPRPLALYVFSSNTETEEKIMNNVSFGGGAINDTVAQFGNHHLSIGGVGASGFGSYHGKASFDCFSHQKSVMKKPFWPDIPIRYAPYKGKLGIVKKLMK